MPDGDRTTGREGNRALPEEKSAIQSGSGGGPIEPRTAGFGAGDGEGGNHPVDDADVSLSDAEWEALVAREDLSDGSDWEQELEAVLALDLDELPLSDAEWAALAARYAAPFRAALVETVTPEAFLERGFEASFDERLVGDLALHAFQARVEGAVGTDGERRRMSFRSPGSAKPAGSSLLETATRRLGAVIAWAAFNIFRISSLPQTAIRCLGSKGLKPSGYWTEVWDEEHALADTVLRMARDDLLVAIYSMLMGALDEGVTQAEFAAALISGLAERGWAPPPAGRGVPARLARIHDSHLRVARAAGQWERIRQHQSEMPYLLYQVGPSPVHWEPHRHWEGLILPVDDEFWEYAYPPNGFGCKCRVLQLTAAEADRLEHDGIAGKNRQTVERKGAGASEERTIRVSRERPPRRVVDWTIPSTGMTTQVTIGIDPGWDHHPGRERPQGVRHAFSQHVSRLVNTV